MKTPASGLNPNHIRTISVTFAHLAHSLASLEAAIHEPPSPLSAYCNDLTTEQQAILLDHIAQVRDRLLAAVRMLRLRPPDPIPLSRAISTAMVAAQIALDELSPKRLGGYGLIDAEAGDKVSLVTADLDRTLRRLAALISRPANSDLQARIGKLEEDARTQMLSLIERVVTRHGFIELRAPLTALTELMETQEFEVAVFGRVSCGKSTLINSVIGASILPVGATPVTAVATRIRFSPERHAYARYVDGRSETLTPDQVRELVTESGNPNNRRGVAKVTIDLASLVLCQSHVVLVDTPGVGSLATQGAREAFGYLPRCDLGVLLIDATTAVSREDTDLLHRLSESGIDALVLLTKADLLDETGREQVKRYFTGEIMRAVGRPVPIDLLDARDARAVGGWFKRRVRARCGELRAALDASAARKLAALHATVVDLLRASGGRSTGAAPAQREDIERIALAAERQVREFEAHTNVLIDRLADADEQVIATATRHARTNMDRSIGIVLTNAMNDQAADLRKLIELDLTSTRSKLEQLIKDLATSVRGVDDPMIWIDLATLPALEAPAGIAEVFLEIPHWPAARRRLASRLEVVIGEEVRTAFSDYARVLRYWSSSIVEQLAAQVAIRVEPARAYVRAHAGNASVVEADLAALERM